MDAEIEFEDFDTNFDLFDLDNEENINDQDHQNDMNQEKEDVDEKEKILQSVWKKSEEEVKKNVKQRRPNPKLTERELTGQKGIPALVELFENYNFPHGSNSYERLEILLGKTEYWAHNLYPQANFEDFIDKVAHLGHKRAITNYMKLLRQGLTTDANILENKEVIEDNENKDDEKENKLDADSVELEKLMPSRAKPTKNNTKTQIIEDEADDQDLDNFLKKMASSPQPVQNQLPMEDRSNEREALENTDLSQQFTPPSTPTAAREKENNLGHVDYSSSDSDVPATPLIRRTTTGRKRRIVIQEDSDD